MIAFQKFRTALRLARGGRWQMLRRRLRSHFAEQRLRRSEGKPFAYPHYYNLFALPKGPRWSDRATRIRALLAYAS